jgi:hypothetical protein
MTKRKSIPPQIEREILFRNEASCCICGKNNVQIHHIDGNNSNNDLKNLAVLCVEHHDQASSKSSMTRRLTPALVKKFKSDWEARISKKREIARRYIRTNIEEQSFVRFEIKRLVYSLPAFPDKKNTNAIIEQLYNWHLFSDSTKNILKTIGYIRWFLKETQISILLTRLWEFFWQFVDPKDVPMNKKDEKDLVIAIELIGDLGKQIVIIEENPRLFKDFFFAVKHFEDFANWYKRGALKNAIKKQLAEVKRELIEAKKYPQRKTILAEIERKLKNY